MAKSGRNPLDSSRPPLDPAEASGKIPFGADIHESGTAWGELFQQAKSGSQSAIGRLLDQCRGYLTVVVQQEIDHKVRAKVAPSDLVQESLLEAYRGFDRFDGKTEKELLGWLRRTLLNNLTDASRHYRGTARRSIDRECSLQGDSSAENPIAFATAKSSLPLQKVIRNEQQERLLEAIRQLPERQRRAVMLRNLESKPFDEIGEALQISADAARKLWERAIQRLTEGLNSHDRSSFVS